MLVAAGGNECFSFTKNIGMGLVESSINLTSLILRGCVEELIFIGSAGSYDSKLKIGDVLYSVDATQIEISFSEDKSYTPIRNHIRMESFDINGNVSCETLQIKQVTVNSSNYISTDASFAEKMVNANITVENMEFFSVMQVAKHFNLPCMGLFCISNYCDRQAREEFVRNHKMAMKNLERFVMENIMQTNTATKHQLLSQDGQKRHRREGVAQTPNR